MSKKSASAIVGKFSIFLNGKKEGYHKAGSHRLYGTGEEMEAFYKNALYTFTLWGELHSIIISGWTKCQLRKHNL